MKVMQILYSGLGGHGSVAFSLHSAAVAAKSDWRESMMFVGVEPLLHEYERRCREEGISFSYVRSRRSRPWRSWRTVYRSLASDRPDAILMHSVKLILPCWWYAWKHCIPLVGVEHQQNTLKTRTEWWVSRLLMRLADAVVVLTPDYREELKAHLGKAFRGHKVHVIPNGIDIEHFRPVERSPSDRADCCVAGMAARFSPSKCQSLLVQAMQELQDTSGLGSCHLQLAGDGETLEEVKKLAQNLRLEMLVSFPGLLQQQELLAWFHSLDVYVHASEGETLSTSLLQAMAVGLPIVASNVPGIENLLGDGQEYGVLVEDNSPKAFARALNLLAGDAILRKSIGRRARQHVVEKYAQKAMFKKYEKVLLACRKSST